MKRTIEWERLSAGVSPVHRAPAGLKLALALAAIAVTLALPLPAWRGYAALLAALLAVLLAARLPAAAVLRRLLWLEPLAAGVALAALAGPDGARRFWALLARATLCLLVMLLLTATTSFPELLRALRRARLPALLATTLGLAYRYLFLLREETLRLERARRARSVGPARRRRTWRELGRTAGQLFVRTSGRAERVYAAMSARGWT